MDLRLHASATHLSAWASKRYGTQGDLQCELRLAPALQPESGWLRAADTAGRLTCSSGQHSLAEFCSEGFGERVQIGIVGLPNVGKSTTFNLLTKLAIPAENFPFCTIEPNNVRACAVCFTLLCT